MRVTKQKTSRAKLKTSAVVRSKPEITYLGNDYVIRMSDNQDWRTLTLGDLKYLKQERRVVRFKGLSQIQRENIIRTANKLAEQQN